MKVKIKDILPINALIVKCPYCGKSAQLTTGETIYPHRMDLHHLKFWQCRPCDAYVGCYKPNPASKASTNGVVPLGRLANAQLRSAKKMAHAVFDPIWKNEKKSRGSAYKWLADQLGIERERCHIGEFDVDMCMRVIKVCRDVSSCG